MPASRQSPASVCRSFVATLAVVTAVAPALAGNPKPKPTPTPTPANGVSSFQSAARPFGLNIVDPVKVSGYDASAAQFNQHDLQSLRRFTHVDLKTSHDNGKNTSGLQSINPEKLSLKFSYDVRTYFVGEGTGNHNTLGFNTSGGGVTGGNPKLIFPDASTNSPVQGDPNGDKYARTSDAPLQPGDYVNLGNMSAGTLLNFFMVGNGANGGKSVYSTQSKLNPGGLQHAVAYTRPGSPYLLIGFEDLYEGGDRDYNDVLFAIDIGMANVAALSGPEPATWATLGMMLGVAFVVGKRRRSSNSAVSGSDQTVA